MFCTVPFLTGNMNAVNHDVCCVAEAETFNKDYTNLEGWWNHPKLCEMRKQWVAGEVPAECKGCVDKKDPYFDSSRHLYDAHVNGNFDEYRMDESGRLKNKPLRMTVSASNHCNLKCSFCPSIFNGRTHELSEVDYQIIEECAPTLREFNLTGGEPFYHPSTRRILRILKPYKDQIKLVVHTNGTFSKPDLLDDLFEFKQVELCFSIDSSIEAHCKKRGYVFPQRLIDNLKTAHNYASGSSEHKVGIHMSISADVAPGLPHFIDDLYDSIGVKHVDFITATAITWPFEEALSKAPELRHISEIFEGVLTARPESHLTDDLFATLDVIKFAAGFRKHVIEVKTM